ncbi:hypothetical protein E4U45_007587, partial [Claviceps purpurea]
MSPPSGPSRIMESWLYSAEASSSQSSSQPLTQPLTQTTLWGLPSSPQLCSSPPPPTAREKGKGKARHECDVSLSLQPSSSPPPPTAREKSKCKGKGKAVLIQGDVYDVYLAPPWVHRSAGKERLPNNASTFTYQGDVFVRDKVISPMTYANLKSIIWKYGEAVRKNSDKKLKWYCYVCERFNLVQSLAGAPGG